MTLVNRPAPRVPVGEQRRPRPSTRSPRACRLEQVAQRRRGRRRRSGSRSTSSGLTCARSEVEHVGDAAGHAGRELRPVAPRITTLPPVMYSQPWSPTPSTTAVGAGVAHAEPLARRRRAGRPRRRSRRRAMTLPAMTLSSATNVAPAVGPDDEPPAGQALADVVVGVALEPQRDAARQERAERLPGRAGEGQVDGAVGQARAAVRAGHLRAEHRADGAVDVADGSVGTHRLAVGRARRRTAAISSLSSAFVEPVVLRRDRAAPRRAVGQLGHVQDRREVEARRPSSARRPRAVSSTSAWPIASASVRKPSAARSSRTSSAMKAKKVSTNSGWPVNRSRSTGFCVATPTGQVSRWQTRIITQPDDDQRRGREAELLRAEQRGHDDVAAGLELAVGLDHDPVAQPVEQQRLLGLGEAELPRRAGVLERGERGWRPSRRRDRR